MYAHEMQFSMQKMYNNLLIFAKKIDFDNKKNRKNKRMHQIFLGAKRMTNQQKYSILTYFNHLKSHFLQNYHKNHILN